MPRTTQIISTVATITATETGVSISAELPSDVVLEVTTKTLEDTGIDTSIYPIGEASLFYDVTLYQNDTEYQPENGITVTFPEAAILDSGLEEGDYYKVYHIHDGFTDVTGPFQYNGGNIDATFESLSVVGVTKDENTIDLSQNIISSTTDIRGSGSVGYWASLTSSNNEVIIYDDIDASYVNVYRITDYADVVIELLTEYTLSDGTVYYQFSSNDSVLSDYSYYFISAENVSIICRCQCDTCTGIAGCSCCENCTCADTEKTLTDENYPGVVVSGKFESGVKLFVETATLEDVMAVDPNIAGIPENYIGMDISLLENNEKIQPNESVTVSIDVSNVASTSEDVLIYHAHQNDDNSVTSEVLGPFTADSNGYITFEMSQFSYLLVFNANYNIEGIEAFYPGTLEGSDSTNDQLTFLGVYYDSKNIAHFLLAFAANSNATNAESKFEHVTIDTTTYYKENVTYSMKDAKFSNLILKDESGNTVYTNPASDKKGYGGVFDITLGEIQVRDGFFFGVNNINTGNGWRIGCNLVLDLDYELIKTVAAGTSVTGSFGESVTVDRGDWVIFEINVNNKGDRPLTDMLVKDILPTGVFDMHTVQMSIDGVGGVVGNWEPFNSTMFSNYNSEGNFSRQLYIKAQVDPNLSITTDTTYINKATIDGMNMPTYEDTASVTVLAPKEGTLTVSKAVTSENPNDPAPDTIFTFTVHSDAANAGPFHYTKSGETPDSVENDGTFTLKNGESIVFSDFSVGNFTITETDAVGFATKVNGTQTSVYTGTMEDNGSIVVAFENQFNTRYCSLTIKKDGLDTKVHTAPENCDRESAVIKVQKEGDETPFYVVLNKGNNYTATISGLIIGDTYTVEEVSSWTWRYKDVTYQSNGTAGSNVCLVADYDAGTEVDKDNLIKNYVVITNSNHNDKWLGGDNYAVNVFDQVSEN